MLIPIHPDKIRMRAQAYFVAWVSGVTGEGEGGGGGGAKEDRKKMRALGSPLRQLYVVRA